MKQKMIIATSVGAAFVCGFCVGRQTAPRVELPVVETVVQAAKQIQEVEQPRKVQPILDVTPEELKELKEIARLRGSDTLPPQAWVDQVYRPRKKALSKNN